MNVADALERWAEETPFAVAIAERERLVAYRELDAAVWRIASRLSAAGLRPGDRVGLSLAGNSALYLATAYAVARLGAVLLLLPLGEPPALRQALARRLKLAAVIGADESAALDGIPLLKPVADWGKADAAPVAAGLRAEGGAAAWRICLSSGTTGTPKAMVRTHADQICLCEIGHRQVGHAPGHRFLALIAFHFSYGLEEAMVTLGGGGTVIIAPLPISMPELCAVIDRENVTRVAVTPTLASELLPWLTDEVPRFPDIRRFSISTMFTPEPLRRELRRRVTANLVICYGTNELWYIAAADVETQLRFPEAAGHPVDGVEIEIVDGRDRALPPGEVGLVRLRGATLPAGYLDDPEATAKAFRSGWYYPGDLGVLAPEGVLFLKGRADDMINYDGIKIYPAEIEVALQRHPDVAEAAAFPVTIDGYRQLPVAAVVPRGSTSAEALVAFCREQIGERAPVKIWLFDTLPRTATGKVLKRELAERLSRAVAERRSGA